MKNLIILMLLFIILISCATTNQVKEDKNLQIIESYFIMEYNFLVIFVQFYDEIFMIYVEIPDKSIDKILNGYYNIYFNYDENIFVVCPSKIKNIKPIKISYDDFMRNFFGENI